MNWELYILLSYFFSCLTWNIYENNKFKDLFCKKTIKTKYTKTKNDPDKLILKINHNYWMRLDQKLDLYDGN